MGLLNLFSKPVVNLMRLPSGCFTVNRQGQIVISTLPQSFPAALADQIARHVLKTFKAAQAVQLPLSELTVNYSSLKLTARELRGGAIVFLSPQMLSNAPK